MLGKPIYSDIKPQFKNKVNWSRLSRNFAAIYILEKNLDKVDWQELLFNPEKNYVQQLSLCGMFEYVPFGFQTKAMHNFKILHDKQAYFKLANNTKMMSDLEQSLNSSDNDLITEEWLWYAASSNPAATYIFANMDYAKMKKNMQPLAKELAAFVFRPTRVQKTLKNTTKTTLKNINKTTYLLDIID